MIIFFDSFNFRSIFLVSSSLCFDSHQFRLVSALLILRFDSSACYKQTSMLI